MSLPIDLIAAAHPDFMKIASILEALNASQTLKGAARLIHTGQYYDRPMLGEFFEQLGLLEPDINLGAAEGRRSSKTEAIMIGYENVLAATRSDLCIVVRDETSILACAIFPRRISNRSMGGSSTSA